MEQHLILQDKLTDNKEMFRWVKRISDAQYLSYFGSTTLFHNLKIGYQKPFGYSVIAFKF